MKKIFTILSICLLSNFALAQYNYNASEEFPFGKANPEAPEQIKDYAEMIGECQCKSTQRKQDGTWAESTDMLWTWTYILNGMAVKDESFKSDGSHSGSIRQFIADSSRWYVHWFSSKTPSTKLPVWEGNRKDGKIVLYKEQKAPNGMEGFFRLMFYDISKSGFKWIGEWVDTTETVIYPTWKIECVKK